MLQQQARQQQCQPSPSSSCVPSTPQSVSKRSQDGSGRARGPFSGLVVCVTGLTKEARKQVQQATEAMGGAYSPDLHLRCTHLVVQICAGQKFDHAVKHGLRRGLFVVTVSWFVNCARQHARLDEAEYSVERSQIDAGVRPEDFSRALVAVPSERFCLPPGFMSASSKNFTRRQRGEQQQCKQEQGVFSGTCFFVDADVQPGVRKKVLEAAVAGDARAVECWFIGCTATHVVCEGAGVLKYVGFNTHIVSPTWVFRTAKEKHEQRCVQFSVDLSRQLACFLEHVRGNDRTKLAVCGPLDEKKEMAMLRQRQDEVAVAKADVRRRRTLKLQAFRTDRQPVAPSTLLDTVCWSVTELPGTASMFTNSAGLLGDEAETQLYFEPHDRGRFKERSTELQESEVFTRPMSETEKWEMVYNATFLTILFPIDQFGDMGPTSKTFVSKKGFTRQEILEIISKFYQDFLTPEEVQVAIHTDSKLADQLRSSYASNESIDAGYVAIRRSQFLGMRKNFEGLKRISKETSGQVYELVIGA